MVRCYPRISYTITVAKIFKYFTYKARPIIGDHNLGNPVHCKHPLKMSDSNFGCGTFSHTNLYPLAVSINDHKKHLTINRPSLIWMNSLPRNFGPFPWINQCTGWIRATPLTPHNSVPRFRYRNPFLATTCATSHGFSFSSSRDAPRVYLAVVSAYQRWVQPPCFLSANIQTVRTVRPSHESNLKSSLLVSRPTF